MKHPAGLIYPVGWPLGFRWAIGTLVLCLTFVTLFFVYTITMNPAGQWWRGAVTVTACILAMGLLWRHCRHETTGHLRYDGERWWYQPLAPSGHVFVELPVALSCLWDFQSGMWLAFRWEMAPDFAPEATHNRLRYAWAEQRAHAAYWHAFRRAIVFHQRAPDNAQPVTHQG